MGAVGGVGGGASPVQQVPPTKGGGPDATQTPPGKDPAAPGGPAGATAGADAVGQNATGGGGAVDAAGGAALNDPKVIELLNQLVQVLTQLIAALQG
ncbi:MAG: hypothetical protein KDC46_14415, partial [Thermoleophilia bacterium]|nr:hypothetical protein [Thermoleophilia bacterium]